MLPKYRSAGLFFQQASIQKRKFRAVDLDRPLLCKTIQDAADDFARGADTGCHFVQRQVTGDDILFGRKLLEQ